MLTFDNPGDAQFSVDTETRTLVGLALPYNTTAKSDGLSYSFTKGTVLYDETPNVPLLWSHKDDEPIGRVVSLTETDAGLVMRAKVAKTQKGDEVLSLASEGIVTGLSVGIATDAKFRRDRDGINYAVTAPLQEISACTFPAFSDARIQSVAASATDRKESKMEIEETVEAVETPPVSLSADEIRGIVADEIKNAPAFSDPRPVVPAGAPSRAVFAVVEEPVYRFSGNIPGKHDFSADLIAGVNGDREALDRAMKFTKENLLSGPKFVESTDVASVNQPQYRPDMYKDEGPAQPTPLYNFFYKGGLSSIQPFFYSQFDSASGLLDDHTEGVEPTPGSFGTETGATVTPTPISGKIHITREVADLGGNPQVSGMIWAKFQREFRAQLEEKTADALVAGTYNDFGDALATGADAEAIAAAIESGVIDLNFRADGSRFEKMFGHVDLYKTLAGATATDGRKLYPILNPSNADGTSGTGFGYISVAGLRIEPTWSLGTTSVGASAAEGRSFVADRNALHVWNSGLVKLEKLNESVEGWDLGAWAYVATHRYDTSGILEVGYDKS